MMVCVREREMSGQSSSPLSSGGGDSRDSLEESTEERSVLDLSRRLEVQWSSLHAETAGLGVICIGKEGNTASWGVDGHKGSADERDEEDGLLGLDLLRERCH